MQNFVQPGNTVEITAPYAVTSGMLVAVGNIVGVAPAAIANGAKGELCLTGVYTLPKTSALQIDIGDLVYLDDTNHVVNKTASGQSPVGVALSAAANPSASVVVRLNGSFTAKAS